MRNDDSRCLKHEKSSLHCHFNHDTWNMWARQEKREAVQVKLSRSRSQTFLIIYVWIRRCWMVMSDNLVIIWAVIASKNQWKISDEAFVYSSCRFTIAFVGWQWIHNLMRKNFFSSRFIWFEKMAKGAKDKDEEIESKLTINIRLGFIASCGSPNRAVSDRWIA